MESWRDIAAAKFIDHTTLHYLDGKIHVEVLLPLDCVADISAAKSIARELQEHAQRDAQIAHVEVRFHG
jgi:hypothetical protein